MAVRGARVVFDHGVLLWQAGSPLDVEAMTRGPVEQAGPEIGPRPDRPRTPPPVHRGRRAGARRAALNSTLCDGLALQGAAEGAPWARRAWPPNEGRPPSDVPWCRASRSTLVDAFERSKVAAASGQVLSSTLTD